MQSIKDKAKFLIGWPLSIVAILFIINYLASKSSEISGHIDSINIHFLALSFLILVIFWFLRGLLWKFLIDGKENKISLIDNAYLLEASEIKRFVPGNIWAFLGRGVLFSKRGLSMDYIAKNILLEIELFILGGLFVSSFSIPWILTSDDKLLIRLSEILPFSLLLALIYFLVITAVFKRRYFKNKSYPSLLILPGLSIIKKVKLVLLSCLMFSVFGIGNYLILLSLMPVFSLQNAIELSAFFVFSFMVGYLSFITPMGLGVREGVVTLGLLKISNLTFATFFAIFSRVILIISELTYLCVVYIIFKVKQNK